MNMMRSSGKKKSRFDLMPCWWRPWSDLPHDILCLIINNKKLLLIDRVRFRAVCKSWYIPKDQIIISSYPWLFFSSPNYNLDHSFRFKFLDPLDHTSSIVSKSIVEYNNTSSLSHPLVSTYASKCGWMLYGYVVQGRVWSLFFHNPFSNNRIALPPLSFPFDIQSCAATFTATPSSPDPCEVLVLYHRSDESLYYIGRYKYIRNGEEDKFESWTIQPLDVNQLLLSYNPENSHVSVHYMDGKLYCCSYIDGCIMEGVYCYTLADKTWEVVSPRQYMPVYGIWLTQIGSSLGMVCLCSSIQLEWKIFKFDWSLRRWTDIGKDLRNMAFFVGKQTIVSLPLEEEEDDSLIFCVGTYYNFGLDGVGCYSFKQRINVIPPDPYHHRLGNSLNLGFIEPTFFVS